MGSIWCSFEWGRTQKKHRPASVTLSRQHNTSAAKYIYDFRVLVWAGKSETFLNYELLAVHLGRKDIKKILFKKENSYFSFHVS